MSEFELSAARLAANLLMERMKPFCERVEVAGSIRRGKETVKDIEIVAVPKWQHTTIKVGLFGEERESRTNLLHEWALRMNGAVLTWIKPGISEIVEWAPKPDGRYWRGLLPGGMKLDLFLTAPERWGSTFLIRTGSATFSHEIAIQALKVGKQFHGGALMEGDIALDTPEESDVFRLLELDWVDPKNRIDARSVRRLARYAGVRR